MFRLHHALAAHKADAGGHGIGRPEDRCRHAHDILVELAADIVAGTANGLQFGPECGPAVAQAGVRNLLAMIEEQVLQLVGGKIGDDDARRAGSVR